MHSLGEGPPDLVTIGGITIDMNRVPKSSPEQRKEILDSTELGATAVPTGEMIVHDDGTVSEKFDVQLRSGERMNMDGDACE